MQKNIHNLDDHMLANPLFTSHYLAVLTHPRGHARTHKHIKTHPHVHTQSPSISFRRVPSALQREYPTALEKRFNSEMRESSGKCTGHIKALMLLHESKQACWVHRQRLVSCASSEAKAKSCELLGKMAVCLLNLYTGLRKKEKKTHKNHYISKQMTRMIKSSDTHTHTHLSLLQSAVFLKHATN